MKDVTNATKLDRDQIMERWLTMQLAEINVRLLESGGKYRKSKTTFAESVMSGADVIREAVQLCFEREMVSSEIAASLSFVMTELLVNSSNGYIIPPPSTGLGENR